MLKNNRRIDILKSKLKRGSITQKEYESEVKKIQSKSNEGVASIPNGSTKISYKRPNNVKPDDSVKNIKHIVYKDKYQIIVDTSLVTESEDDDTPRGMNATIIYEAVYDKEEIENE